MLAKKALGCAPAAVASYIEDVFSTYLYTGNGSTKTITNDIDISGEGGLVWLKNRTTGYDHGLFDTERGVGKGLRTNLSGAEFDLPSTTLTAFSSTGSSVGDNVSFNESGTNIVSWTFRQAEKFFDVVTYTGTGSERTVSHNLGSTPGCIIVKKTSDAANWFVYHTSLGATKNLKLNLTNAEETSSSIWNNTAPTSTVFTVGSSVNTNESGQSYVAYLFAHDAGGFGEAGDQNIISCGSYTGNGSDDGPTITLNYEPQWILIKRSSSADNWIVVDIMRGFSNNGTDDDYYLIPNSSSAETTFRIGEPTATGFKLRSLGSNVNASGDTYIYIAIRRGPMKTPEVGTEVFSPVVGTGNDPSFTSSWPVDASILLYPTGGNSNYQEFNARLIGENRLVTSSSAAESSNSSLTWDYSNGICDTAFTSSFVANLFRRAPGFFDVVTYAGTGSAGATVSHNLAVAPELIITRVRNFTGEDWIVHYNNGSSITAGYLNSTDAFANSSTAPSTDLNSFTSTTYNRNTGSRRVNGSYNYIAYLFASLAGISKVGTYTGNGSSQTINCGFTSGARFILIKRTDSTGDWVVFDSARGIVSGNDPFLQLNSTAAEVTNEDAVDTNSTGFVVNETTEALNTNSATYLYLAIS